MMNKFMALAIRAHAQRMWHTALAIRAHNIIYYLVNHKIIFKLHLSLYMIVHLDLVIPDDILSVQNCL